MGKSICKGCGKEIEWGKTEDGKNIPLIPAKSVYCFTEDGSQIFKLEKTHIQTSNQGGYEAVIYQSHFLDCPKANDFSGKNK